MTKQMMSGVANSESAPGECSSANELSLVREWWCRGRRADDLPLGSAKISKQACDELLVLPLLLDRFSSVKATTSITQNHTALFCFSLNFIVVVLVDPTARNEKKNFG